MTFLSRQPALTLGGLLLALQVLALYVLGQPPICTCGYVKLWEGVVLSIGNSQHITDWYTLSHIIHGIVFYGFLRYFFPTLSLSERFLLALGLEVSWEIIENTPYVINLYRAQALAVGYSGDSILNSIMDTLAMIGGFVLAYRASFRNLLIFVLALELVAAYMIRDNLALNILNFIYTVPAIEAWQSGGG